MPKPTEQQLNQCVRQNVLCCVSSLVGTLARSWDGGCIQGPRGRDGAQELAELAEQAAELCYPVDDYMEALRGESHGVRHDMHGFYVCSLEEAEHEDAGNASVGFDGRPHFATIEDAARKWCYENNVDPCQWEIFEHYAVSDWLAEKLEAKGERVGDFGDLKVWGRTCTGQAISMDGVIIEICAESLNLCVGF